MRDNDESLRWDAIF